MAPMAADESFEVRVVMSREMRVALGLEVQPAPEVVVKVEVESDDDDAMEAGGFQIFCRMMDGTTATVETTETSTIASIKRKLLAKCGMPVSHQRLVYAGKNLEDHYCLKDVPILAHATLHMHIKLNPSVAPSRLSETDRDLAAASKAIAYAPSLSALTALRTIRVRPSTTIPEFRRMVCAAYGIDLSTVSRLANILLGYQRIGTSRSWQK